MVKEVKTKSEEKKKKKLEKKKIEEKIQPEVKKQPTKKEKQIKKKKQFKDPYKIIIYPVSTEKSIRLMEAENKLIFRVALKSKKSEIKKAIEDLFNVKVAAIKTLINAKGHKRAYVKFSEETPAIDIATQLGMV